MTSSCALGLQAVSCHGNDATRAFKKQTVPQTGRSHQFVLLQVDFMKTLYVAFLLATVSLGGCCLSSSGCNMSPIATARPDLDGLGQPPAEDPPSPTPKQRVSSRAKDRSEEPMPVYGNSSDGTDLEDEDARLKRKLIICRGCAVPGN